MITSTSLQVLQGVLYSGCYFNLYPSNNPCLFHFVPVDTSQMFLFMLGYLRSRRQDRVTRCKYFPGGTACVKGLREGKAGISSQVTM